MALGSPCPQRDHTEHRSADEVALSVSSSLLGVAQTSFCFHLVVPELRGFLSTTSIRLARGKAHHAGVHSLSVRLGASVFRLFVTSWSFASQCVSMCLHVFPYVWVSPCLAMHLHALLIVSPCVSLCSHTSSCVSFCLLANPQLSFSPSNLRLYQLDKTRSSVFVFCLLLLCPFSQFQFILSKLGRSKRVER